jgi:phosphatidylserine/phosphatidylglycerophosphate/cardiolipin synthase-like enzyme
VPLTEHPKWTESPDWFLNTEERGNPHTRLRPFTTGNDVRPLIEGSTYYADLLAAVRRQRKGDLLLFTDWRGDPDERLDGAGTEIGRVFSEAAERGVLVKGLIWRSHWDRLAFSAAENRHLGDEIEAAGGECLRDMRVRSGGSHHQKFVVLRHPGRPELDVAYVGGIDLCHSRRDTSEHTGDPQPLNMSARYGPRPPWHDVQVAIRGPAVGDVETTFRERWSDPTPLSRNPVYRVQDLVEREDTRPGRLPEQLPDPPPAGELAVQLLRTYPYRRRGYPFAPLGERSIAQGYCKVATRARRLIYLEDQYLWSSQVVSCFAEALRNQPELRLIAVVPRYPDQPGKVGGVPQLVGRSQAINELLRAGGDRVAVYTPENREGVPVYVHAKVCVVDDEWATVGSDNVSLRSWTHDSELTCAVFDPSGAYGRGLRTRLGQEHLELSSPDRLVDPVDAFAAFAESAAALQAWHDNGGQGARPNGRLRPYQVPQLSSWTRRWSRLLYRSLFDPDGRPPRIRGTDTF